MVPQHERKKKRSQADMLNGLPEEEVLLELPEDQLVCGKCGGKMKPIAYLQHVLLQLPYLGKTHSHQELESLMPWAPYIQQEFGMKDSNAYVNTYLD